MSSMLSQVCAELRNYFTDPDEIRLGAFVISEGQIALDDVLMTDQYFRIVGSVFNDGVYKYPATNLVDEEFEGAIWPMRVPQRVIALSEDIEQWQTSYGALDSPAMSPFISESFGGYSYSKGGGGSSSAMQLGADWKQVFANRLQEFRRVRVL